jgi:phospholipid/cholesterol/gamma-HCH transport system substrate-binding protein
VKRELLIGIVAITAIAALIFGLFYLKGENLLSENRAFHTTYQRVDGLVNASPVKISGFQVGVVTGLTMNEDDPSLIDVTFIVDDPSINIPSNSVAMLASDILGNKSIDLRLGTDSRMLKDGDFVLAQAQTDLTDMVNEQLLPLKLKTEELIATIDSTVEIVKTIIGENTGNLNESFIGLRNAIGSFESMSNRLDTLIARQSSRVSAIFTNVVSITDNLKKSNDAITKVLANAEMITDSLAMIDFVGTVSEAQNAIAQVNLVLDAINNGDGTISKLLNDSTMYNNVNLMVDQATTLVENIQDHPNRYLQFAVFGSKDKGLKLDSRNERALRQFVKRDSLMNKWK